MKMKFYRTILAIFLVSIIFLTACSIQGIENGGETNSTENEANDKQSLELTIFYHDAAGGAFNDKWATFVEAAKVTGITLKGVAPSAATNHDEVFNLMMASGNLPDIICGKVTELTKYGKDQALVDISPYLGENTPNLNDFFSEYPNAKKYVTDIEGKIYSVPYMSDPKGKTAAGFFIRKDWLDNLGLSVPVTVDELYGVMTAFRNNDPNGNKTKDEIPFFGRNPNDVINTLLVLYGSRSSNYIEDGAVVNPYLEPELKDAVKMIAKWYSEKLIDQEVYSRGGTARDVLFGENTGGMVHDWFASTAGYNDTLKDMVPGFELQPILPPANVNGEVIEETARTAFSDRGWAISSNSKYVEEVVKYFDFWMSDAGKLLANYGVEGVHYEMQDGKPTFTTLLTESSLSLTEELRENGINLFIGTLQDFAVEQSYMNPVAADGMTMYVDADVFPKDKMPERLNISEEDQAIMNKYGSRVNTYQSEQMQKWVMGIDDIDATFDAYLEQMKALGAWEILGAMQRSYDAYGND